MAPTKIRNLVLVAAVCGVASWLITRTVYTSLPALPWNGIPTLIIVAGAEAYGGILLRARIHRRPGTKPIQPIGAARAVALAKATAYAAAVIGGVMAGFAVYVAGSLDKVIPRHDFLASAGTFAAAVVLAAAALFLEYCCRVPKEPGGEDYPEGGTSLSRR